jgi:hypothetical protein
LSNALIGTGFLLVLAPTVMNLVSLMGASREADFTPGVKAWMGFMFAASVIGALMMAVGVRP